MIQVLHIFGRMNRGGTEMRTLDVMRHVDRGRYRLHFCSLSGQPGELDDEIRSLGGEVHLLPLGPGFPWRFRGLLRQNRINVVHSHVHYPSGLMVRLAAKEGVPVRVTHFRCTDDGRGNGLPRRVQRWCLRRWIDRYSTNILAVSRSAIEASWGPGWQRDSRCRVLYNGIDLSQYTAASDRAGVFEEFGIRPRETLYIHVGRMDPAKNHVRLASIFSEVIRREPDSRLLLVGRGGNAVEKRLRARLHELGVTDRMIFAGVRSDVPRLLKAADLMIFPSLNEGLPGAVLEANAAGTPVLASRISTIEEITRHLGAVEAMPLSAPDATWAERAIDIAAMSRASSTRLETSARFSDSVFSLSSCVAANEAIWDGKAAR